MSKKISLLNKRKPTKPGDPPPSTKIRETLVGDPSISFTVALDRSLVPSDEGYYVVDFKAALFLSDVPNPEKDDLVEIATIQIKSLTTQDPYLYIPFGDPDYGAGQQFYFFLWLSGKDPVTGKPIKFNDSGNCFVQSLIGGGIVETFGKSNGKAKSKGRKK